MKTGQFRMRRSSLAGAEAVEAETRHQFSRHAHDQFGIGVVWRGAQRSASHRGPVEAGPGDVITCNAGEVHDGAPIGDAGRAWRILYVDPAVIAEAAGDLSEGRSRDYEFADPVIRDPAIAAGFRSLYAAATSDSDALGAEGWLLALLARAGLAAPSRSSAIPAGVARARALIDDDPAAPVTLADLARVSGLSRFQVLRGFAKATGLTPHAYLVQRRIQAARRRIARGARLADAALASGFADQSHMTRTFVRAFGVSPRAYADAVT